MNLILYERTLKSACKYCSSIPFFFERNLLFTIALFILTPFAVLAQNPIPAENSLTGNPSSEWDITGAGDVSLQGFATDISVNKGQTVNFKITITGANKNYSIKIYRLGYYQGNGARLITTLGPFLGVTQPAPVTNAASGLNDCGNWSPSTSWAVPATAVSGIYIARLIRADNGGASHIVFIVRDDAANAHILFKTSDATWQAYNAYGGNSLYLGATPGFPNGHATKVSYNRPFITRSGGGGGGAAEDWLFNAEYPMIRWLERNGYYLGYTTDVDMDRNATPITPAKNKVILSVGHDEYWSLAERNKVEAARNAGVHLAFFSGNEVYWKTRWENSIDGSNTPYRTLVCYKEGTLGENVCNAECDPTNIWTGLWRDGCGATAPDGCKPENALTGQISWFENTTSILVPDTYKNYRFWRNTSVALLGAGQTATLPAGTLGYEWDWEQPAYAVNNPSGRFTLSSTTVTGKTHKLSLYRHSSGALVFGAGTIQWSWGLDGTHDRGVSTPSVIMQQATVNLLADMGVQPATLQAGLVAATASTDLTPPASVITFPANGATLAPNVAVTITGTASDANVVAGIEVSVDGGTTWKPANGTTNWTFSWTPTAPGTVTIKVRGFDDSGNMEVPGTAPANNAKSVIVGTATPCPCTIWSPSTIPGTIADPDVSANELGVKFRSSTNGYIKGVRFYKSSTNTGTHIGNLWTATGTNLAQSTFTGETASGWQEVTFTTPVPITAGTTYIASYHTSTGHYSVDENYFTTSAVVTPYLEALRNGTDGPNGVYAASANSTFPTSTFNSSNYYVDVVFITSLAPDNTPPTIVNSSPVNGATTIAINTAVSAVFNEAIDPATINGSTFELRNASNVLVPATVTYNTSTRTALLTPTSALNYSTVYTAKLFGGTGSTVIKDIAGNALAANYIFSFTTSAPPPPVPSEGPGGPILVISAASNPFSRYPVEILRAEGFNNFFATDISAVTPTLLNNYDVVVLGEIPLSSQNVTDLTNWTNAGGTLVALKPDAQLNSLLGLTAVAGSLANGYLLVNTASGPGIGIVNQTIQFHGTSNLYTLSGATSLATLYSSATTASSNPAVTSRAVGSNGGMAVAFSYDLAKSVVYTRQGNPAQAGQKLDGSTGPIRSDDMFYPSWINLSKVAIPQADEQQHLLSNIIAKYTLDRKPLPRFWFLPKGLKAAVVMTGDDHAVAGPSTVNRFNQYKSLSADNSPAGVADWNAIRGTSYIFPGTAITDAQTSAFQADGFEIGLHLNTNCANWTASSWQSNWTSQYATLLGQLPSMLPQKTHRIHCIAWSDFATQPKKNVENGVRLDVNYYYFPAAWVLDRPGMFTGSGMPMRFSDVDGTLIDCYQVTTQLTDESGQTLPLHISALLDSAIGAPGYYGVFCANMHTDNNSSTSQSGSDAIVSAAQARSIPVISAKQMLDWLDGRNGSTFNNLVWNNNQLSFTITAAPGSRNMKAMLPVNSSTATLNSITYNGSSIPTTTQTIKGIVYAFFDATLGSGTYTATYTGGPQPPVISNVVAIPTSNGSATITWNTAQIADSKVDYGTLANNLSLTASNASQVTSHSITLTGLTQGTIYYFRVTSKDALLNSTTFPIQTDPPLNFTMPSTSCPVITLDASGSTGTISSYAWTRVSGPNVPVITSPSAVSTTVTGLIQGTYVFQLSLNGGASTSQVLVNVNPPASPLVSHAGYDRTITLPTSAVTLDGNGSSGTISGYTWTRITGPNTPVITTPTAVTATASGLVQGVYTFELIVTDGSTIAKDTVQVTVNAAVSGGGTSPVVSAVNTQFSRNGTSVNTLTGVPAGALLVLSVAQEYDIDDLGAPHATITSSPALTWTKRADAQAATSGNAEIYTAVYPAGGSITVTSAWVSGAMSSVVHVITNYDPASYIGSSSVVNLQTSPSLAITTTQSNSLIIGVTSDYAAINGASRIYRDGATESFYDFGAGAYAAYYYRKPTTAIGTYTEGLTAPTGMKAGTVLLEIKGPAAAVTPLIAYAGGNRTIFVSTAPTGNTSQSFCNAATVANLTATGTGIQWYAAATGGTPLPGTTPLVSGNHYYASQTIGGCESVNRLDVTVTITTTAAPAGNTAQSFCNAATVVNLTATGTAIQWYAAATGGTPLPGTTPLISGNHYYASQTIGGCESVNRLDVTVTITTNTVAAPTGNTAQNFCNASTVASLVATGTAIQWYAAATGGTPLPGTTPLINGTHYYASQTISPCESSTRLDVTVTITTSAISAPGGNASQSFCNAATVANLTATGTNIKWYSTATGGTPLPGTTPLINGNHYYASQTIGGCESTTRLDVTVTITTAAAPAGSTAQSFCNAATVANLTATGTAIQWYAAATGGTALLSTTPLISGNHYYAGQTISGCESASRLDVTATINNPAAPGGSASQSFCNTATVANLTATGTAIQWYTAAIGGTALLSTTPLISGNHYYAGQTISGCESTTRLDVTVAINTPAAPTGSTAQSFCSAATVANLSATGSGIKWYAAATGGTALVSTTSLVSGNHYYASQTIGGCESVNRLDVTVTINALPPVTLDASGSTGTITSYAWTTVSGPSVPVITSPAAVTTSVTGLVPGTYIFQLSLNSGASTSRVTVNVNAPASPLTAHAGSDRIITLPVSSVGLEGNGSTGTISGYTWTRITGPNTPVITSPSAVTTTVTGLIQGIYTFELSVTDGSAVVKDTVQVSVNAAPSGGASPVIFSTTTRLGTNNTAVNSLTAVPAGALLVLTIAQADDIRDGANATVTSSPALTWTKRADAGANGSGNAEIYTAVFTAGGTITVTSTWAFNLISAVVYAVTNYDPALGGAAVSVSSQTLPSLGITTTRSNSIIFGVTSDWSAINGSARLYRDAATESLYHFSTGIYTGYHYRKQTTTAGTYTEGLTAPTGMSAGTALLEIKGPAAAVIPLVAFAGNNQSVGCAGGAPLMTRNKNMWQPTAEKTISTAGATLEIYPNPSSGLFNMVLDKVSIGKAMIKITDARGVIIQRKELVIPASRHLAPVELGSAAKGIYFIQVIHPGGVLTGRVIKE